MSTEEKINNLLTSIAANIEELYAIDKDISSWNNSCHVTEAIRSLNNAERRIRQIDLKEEKVTIE